MFEVTPEMDNYHRVNFEHFDDSYKLEDISGNDLCKIIICTYEL